MGSRSGNVNMETSRTTTVLDDLKSFDKGGGGGGGFLDLGHPLLNRIAYTFITAAGIGALQAVSREAYFTAVDGLNSNNHTFSDVPGSAKRNRFPNVRGAGETNRKSLEAMVKNTGKESFQWGVAAGVYSGLTYGLKEARGSHDWKNSAVAGAMTGVALALTAEESSHEQIVQCAFTGAAIAAAANLLSGVF